MYFFISFKGIRRLKTEDKVAVKWFDFTVDFHIQREVETLQKCQRKNIVKYLGFEKVETSLIERKVLIMEYCDKGNLEGIILKNPNGLSSTEFFSAAGDLLSAIKHMHKLNVVHRDFKPGNVLVSEYDNGKLIYKVCDFGAARTLMPGESYSSLYGTQEYIHPNIFGQLFRQVLPKKPTVEMFNERHELKKQLKLRYTVLRTTVYIRYMQFFALFLLYTLTFFGR